MHSILSSYNLTWGHKYVHNYISKHSIDRVSAYNYITVCYKPFIKCYVPVWMLNKGYNELFNRKFLSCNILHPRAGLFVGKGQRVRATDCSLKFMLQHRMYYMEVICIEAKWLSHDDWQKCKSGCKWCCVTSGKDNSTVVITIHDMSV